MAAAIITGVILLDQLWELSRIFNIPVQLRMPMFQGEIMVILPQSAIVFFVVRGVVAARKLQQLREEAKGQQ